MKNGGQIPWNFTCFLRNIQDLFSDGKTTHEMRFGETFSQSRMRQFGKKVFLGILFGYVLYAGKFWKGNIMVVDLEELEKMDGSEIHMEFQEIIKHARRKLEVPTAPAVPCKENSRHGVTRSKKYDHKSKFAYEFYLQIMTTMLQEKEVIHCIITIWFTN